MTIPGEGYTAASTDQLDRTEVEIDVQPGIDTVAYMRASDGSVRKGFLTESQVNGDGRRVAYELITDEDGNETDDVVARPMSFEDTQPEAQAALAAEFNALQAAKEMVDVATVPSDGTIENPHVLEEGDMQPVFSVMHNGEKRRVRATSWYINEHGERMYNVQPLKSSAEDPTFPKVISANRERNQSPEEIEATPIEQPEQPASVESLNEAEAIQDVGVEATKDAPVEIKLHGVAIEPEADTIEEKEEEPQTPESSATRILRRGMGKIAEKAHRVDVAIASLGSTSDYASELNAIATLFEDGEWDEQMVANRLVRIRDEFNAQLVETFRKAAHTGIEEVMREAIELKDSLNDLREGNGVEEDVLHTLLGDGIAKADQFIEDARTKQNAMSEKLLKLNAAQTGLLASADKASLRSLSPGDLRMTASDMLAVMSNDPIETTARQLDRRLGDVRFQ